MSDIDDCLESVERLTRDRGEVMRAGNDKIADRRERIATAALQGMLSNPHNSQWEPQYYFRSAVYYADGLIAELDKEEGKP